MTRSSRSRASAVRRPLYGRLLASAAQHLDGPALRRGARIRLADGQLGRCRSTAGWRLRTRSTRPSSRTSTRRCWTSVAGPGGTSPPCARSASGAWVSISPRSPCGSRAIAARTRSPGRSGRACRAAARGGRSCCWTATSASAARRSRCCAARASCWAPGGRILIETDPPGAPTRRLRIRLEARDLGVGVVPLGARRRRRRRGRRRAGRLRGRARPLAVRPHVRDAPPPLRTQAPMAKLAPIPAGSARRGRSGRASGARRCAARG